MVTLLHLGSRQTDARIHELTQLQQVGSGTQKALATCSSPRQLVERSRRPEPQAAQRILSNPRLEEALPGHQTTCCLYHETSHANICQRHLTPECRDSLSMCPEDLCISKSDASYLLSVEEVPRDGTLSRGVGSTCSQKVLLLAASNQSSAGRMSFPAALSVFEDRMEASGSHLEGSS